MEDTPKGPIVSRESDREWETWSEEEVARRGMVHWKTLISAGITQSVQLTVGLAHISPGEALHEHRHLQAEIYLVLEGNGMVRVGSEARPIETGSAVFVPGNTVHACEARIRERPTYGSPTCLPRIRSMTSSTSSRIRSRPPQDASSVTTQRQAEPKAIACRLIQETFNEGDLDVIADEILAPNYVDHEPNMPEEVRGSEEETLKNLLVLNMERST